MSEDQSQMLLDEIEDLVQSKEQLPHATQDYFNLPPLTSAHLTTQRKRVTTEYLNTIRNLTTKQDAIKYYKDKYAWNTSTVQDIHWQAHGSALATLTGRKLETITQFLHRWLPVNASHSKDGIDRSRLCPYCASCDETQDHFMQCTRRDITKAWTKAARSIKRHLKTYHSHTQHQLLRLLTLAITEWRNTATPKIPDFLHNNFHTLFHRQSEIGWNQIVFGRFSKAWTTIPNAGKSIAVESWQQFPLYGTKCTAYGHIDANKIMEQTLQPNANKLSFAFDHKSNGCTTKGKLIWRQQSIYSRKQ
jgi:hypothetical protein